MEAMNAGLHIVYSKVGGLPEILENYARKTQLNEISEEDIEKILSNVISNFQIKDDSESLSYARTFDWMNLAEKTFSAYECALNK